MDEESVIKIVKEYYNIMDESIDKLSNLNEGLLNRLQDTFLTNKHIYIGVTKDFQGIAIRIEPKPEYEENKYTLQKLYFDEMINIIISPFKTKQTIRGLSRQSFMFLGGMQAYNSQNPLQKPHVMNHSIGMGSFLEFKEKFSEKKARKDALDEWIRISSDDESINSVNSYSIEVNKIVNRLSSIIKRKSFLERRVHRYIYEHKQYLLPKHSKCFFEYKLISEDRSTYRKADFILQREGKLSPILIELESPVHKVLTKNKSLTKESNHAREQIDEWIEYINCNPIDNCKNEMSFLKNTKFEKIVIMGKGIDDVEVLSSKSFSGTEFWTYDMLINEVKKSIEDNFKVLCQTINIDEYNIFDIEKIKYD